MEIQRVCHYVTGFLHAPIRVLDLEGNQTEVYWDSGAQQNPAQLEPELCTALLTLAQPLQPALHVEGKGILYGVVKAHREAYLVGPCRLRDLPPASGEEGGREADFRYVPEISLEQFTNGVLMLYESATGQTMDPGSLWRDSFRSGDLLQHVDRRSHTILFANREEERPHNPYRQERREQNAIQTGDLAALEESFREEYGGRVGTLARTPLRHARNLAIVLITLASRSAIAGGLLPEVAYSLSDAFIQQAEELESEGEVIALARQAEVEYCRRVAALAGGGSRNPLVVRCKELVFQKLHTKIEIQTLAEQLGVRTGSLPAVQSGGGHYFAGLHLPGEGERLQASSDLYSRFLRRYRRHLCLCVSESLRAGVQKVDRNDTGAVPRPVLPCRRGGGPLANAAKHTKNAGFFVKLGEIDKEI